jgi:hypothetical protein
MRDEEKASVLLKTLGIEDRLAEIDKRETAAYNKRHDYGVIADQKIKFAKEAREYPDAGTELVDVNDLMKAANEIAERNSERAMKRHRAKLAGEQAESKRNEAEQLKLKLADAIHEAERLEALAAVEVDADEDAGPIMEQIKEAEHTNAKVRANLDKEMAVAEAERCKAEYNELTAAVEAIRAERDNLLFGTQMPLPELTIGKNDAGKPILLYNGKAWDCTSTSEQYKIATSIVQKLKPECRFVLLDRMEAFDSVELEKFDEWLKAQGLQAICTRVGSNDASIIIEDGYCIDEKAAPFAEVSTESITEKAAEQKPEPAEPAAAELDW